MIGFCIGAVLGFLVCRTFMLHYQNENEILKERLVFVQNKNEKEIERYKDRISILNDTLKVRDGNVGNR